MKRLKQIAFHCAMYMYKLDLDTEVRVYVYISLHVTQILCGFFYNHMRSFQSVILNFTISLMAFNILSSVHTSINKRKKKKKTATMVSHMEGCLCRWLQVSVSL